MTSNLWRKRNVKIEPPGSPAPGLQLGCWWFFAALKVGCRWPTAHRTQHQANSRVCVVTRHREFFYEKWPFWNGITSWIHISHWLRQDEDIFWNVGQHLTLASVLMQHDQYKALRLHLMGRELSLAAKCQLSRSSRCLQLRSSQCTTQNYAQTGGQALDDAAGSRIVRTTWIPFR